MGQRHLRLLEEYAERIARAAKQLHDDCPQFRPVDGTYSPYGVLYGFSSQLLEHMALKAVQPDAVDALQSRRCFDARRRRQARVGQRLAEAAARPARSGEAVRVSAAVRRGHFARIERALRVRVAAAKTKAAARNGQLFVLANGLPTLRRSSIPDLSVQYIVVVGQASRRREQGRCFDETAALAQPNGGRVPRQLPDPGGWVAISKDVLTDVLGAGRNAKVAGLPRDAARVLKLMCPELVVLPR